MDWLLNNKEWVFSGIGIVLISALLRFFFFRNEKTSISQHGNGNVIHSGKGDINNTVNVSAMEQPSYRTEVINGIKTTYKVDPITETESVVRTGLE